MSLDLPAELNALKEEQEQPYDPPYEENQGSTKPKSSHDPAEEVDFINSRDIREPDLPPLEQNDAQSGPISPRGQAVSQDNDELNESENG